jgi:hypothetical protein
MVIPPVAGLKSSAPMPLMSSHLNVEITDAISQI